MTLVISDTLIVHVTYLLTYLAVIPQGFFQSSFPSLALFHVASFSVYTYGAHLQALRPPAAVRAGIAGPETQCRWHFETSSTHSTSLGHLAEITQLTDFYPRDAMLARVFATATCLSVCLSVRLSHAGIVPSRAKARIVKGTPSDSMILVFGKV